MKSLISQILTFILALFCIIPAYSSNPKREFRGAWMHTIFQSQYKNQTTEQNKTYLIRQLDSLQAAGVNAIFFQVRPQSDALYDSKLEPWSRFLTDGGKAPQPYWDPLQFMIEESHKRGLELHAWLNPYRVTSNRRQTLPPGHIYHKHPERFIRYDGKLYFDPGLPENREFIGKVVDDIVSRYDIDGLHLDDYFYPYPVRGKEFADNASFRRYGNGMNRSNWRRNNVDLLMEDLYKRIHAAKPWVRFGVSPFGIWRNKTSDSRGSDTNGLENYDSLYADVLLWEQNGWVDYLLPQLYWDLNHKAASTLILIDWWNRNTGSQRHLYIGQDVERCMSKAELGTKIELSRKGKNIKGNCWWPGYSITRNSGGVADSLATIHQNTIALCPEYHWLSQTAPQAVDNVTIDSNRTISWSAPQHEGKTEDAIRFVVYRFDNLDEIDIDKSEAIITVTPEKQFRASNSGVYIITALSRTNTESEPSIPVVIP